MTFLINTLKNLDFRTVLINFNYLLIQTNMLETRKRQQQKLLKYGLDLSNSLSSYHQGT